MLMWTDRDAAGGDAADIAVWTQYEEKVRAAGVFVDRGALQPPAQATLVRPTITDPSPDEELRPGTFADGTAQIQAFYLLDCADLDEAHRWARELPTYGTVEVRPLLDF